MSGVNDAHNHGVNLENCEYHDHGSGGYVERKYGWQSGWERDVRGCAVEFKEIRGMGQGRKNYFQLTP
jgi:hypothetical protein